jgi:hypothetical protein
LASFFIQLFTAWDYIINPLKTIKMENNKVQGTLVSVHPSIKANANGTQYRTCVVSLPDGNNYIAKIWEKSFQYGVTIGAEYTVEGQQDGDTIWLTVLNGAQANIATVANLGAMFGVKENTLAEPF